MAAGSEVNTVWIGFMDIVPVIGTVKEAVELVLALYEGNKAVIKEKEKAVENIVKESLKKHVKPTARVNSLKSDDLAPREPNGVYFHPAVWAPLPDKPGAEAASEFSGLKNVKEVRKEMIIECVTKGSKKGAKPTAAQQKERERRVEAIKRDVLEKIHNISPNFEFNKELKEQLGRSKRGEHVFNNDILKFHFKVLTDFIQSRGISNIPGYNQQTMTALGRHTLPQNTAKEIQDNMVVRFADDEFYVNANALMYGEYCRALRDALLAVLRHINRDDVTEGERQRVNLVIDNMNNLQIYVDQLAKEKWINNSQARETRFENVRVEVANMYSTDRGFNWCNDVMREVAPLLGY